MQLLHGGRYYVGSRKGNSIAITRPTRLEFLINIEEYPDEHLLIRAELSQPGESKMDGNAGSRLAFSITTKVDNRLSTVYAINNGPWAPYKANTFVDWLNGTDQPDAQKVSTLPAYIIAKFPRGIEILHQWRLH